jgi:archaemetzincin
MKFAVISFNNSVKVAEFARGILEDFFTFRVDVIRAEMPSSFHNPLRNQVYAKPLLIEVKKIVQDKGYFKGLGILHEDIYHKNSSYIFGLAELNGRAALISTFRLVGDGLYTRVLKEVFHEVGHLLGLTHCTNNCVMRFSSNVKETDIKPATYCKVCESKVAHFIKESGLQR